jgi:hypothetical protein
MWARAAALGAEVAVATWNEKTKLSREVNCAARRERVARCYENFKNGYPVNRRM